MIIYNAGVTYANTILEHLSSFARYSENTVYYYHHDQSQEFDIDLSVFDVVVLHYSYYLMRMPHDQPPETNAIKLSEYSGLKMLIIQDEYDHTGHICYWIRQLKIHLVFTLVPTEAMERIFPAEKFPGVHFVPNLTGYVPETIPTDVVFLPASQRNLIVGYRGRELSIRYGKFCREKADIGKAVKSYCVARGIAHDIEWTEESRIYGPSWYQFIASCRAMLGTESGSNVFDWDGTLAAKFEVFGQTRNDEEIYRCLIEPLEMDGVMNQISPKVFEAIAMRSALVLFEGRYSGVVEPERHYIPLRKDFGNLDSVFSVLHDGHYVDEMTDRAYREIIQSGKYSYNQFVSMVDKMVSRIVTANSIKCRNVKSGVILKKNPKITSQPDSPYLQRKNGRPSCDKEPRKAVGSWLRRFCGR